MNPIPYTTTAKADLPAMLVYAFRYCLGRGSYAPGECMDWIRKYRDELSDFDRAQIKADIVKAIARGPIPYEREWAQMAEGL